MKKIFYMMRHGQTLFNLRRKIQGWCDSPLTDFGIEQAKAAGEYFKDIELDHLYCSTAERCSDTLEIVTENRMPYTRLKGLKEMNFGTFEGESEDLNPDRETFETFFTKYGGESRDMCRERVVKTCHEIMEQEDHRCVLAVSHAGACLRFLEHCYDASKLPRNAFSNCAIFKYEYEDGKFTFVEVIQRVPEAKEIVTN